MLRLASHECLFPSKMGGARVVDIRRIRIMSIRIIRRSVKWDAEIAQERGFSDRLGADEIGAGLRWVRQKESSPRPRDYGFPDRK